MPAVARVAPLLAAALTAGSLIACREPPRPARGTASAAARPSVTRPPPPPAGAEELGLIAPIARGSELDGYEVRDVRGVEEGRMRLVCVKGDGTVRLDVALLDPEGALPPATAGQFAIYYSLKGAPPEDGDKLAKRLAAAIAAHPAAAVPRGMTRFVARDKPGTSL